MIANLKKLLNPQAPELVAVLLNRSLLIDGEAFSKGDTVSVSPKTARDLCSDGSATDAKADAAAHEKAAKLSALLPPPIEPLPVPDSWKNMPEVFHKWHQLNESGRVLRDRADEMEDRLIQRAKRYVFHGDLGGISVGIASAHDRNRVLSAVGNAIQVGDIPEHELDETRYMEGAHLRLRKAFSDWLEMHQAEAIKLSFLCGDEVQAHHDRVVIGGPLGRAHVECLLGRRLVLDVVVEDDRLIDDDRRIDFQTHGRVGGQPQEYPVRADVSGSRLPAPVFQRHGGRKPARWLD